MNRVRALYRRHPARPPADWRRRRCRPPPSRRRTPADDFAPVTDAILQDPPADDWLMWRRTLDGWGYSPLDQIDRGNVGDLRMVWSRGLGPGLQQGTPLVHDGVMYMPNPRDVIQAIDAATGDLRWEYRRDLPDDLRDYMLGALTDLNRNLAIYGTHIIDTSGDDYVFALDAASGELAWETRDPRLPREPRQPELGPHHRQRQDRVGPRLHPAGRPRTPASSSPTTPSPARSCGGGAPSPPPASRATRPGAGCRSKSASTSARGWCRATTPS